MGEEKKNGFLLDSMVKDIDGSDSVLEVKTAFQNLLAGSPGREVIESVKCTDLAIRMFKMKDLSELSYEEKTLTLKKVKENQAMNGLPMFNQLVQARLVKILE